MSREDFLRNRREYDDKVAGLKQRLETAEMRKRQMKDDEGDDVLVAKKGEISLY